MKQWLFIGMVLLAGISTLFCSNYQGDNPVLGGNFFLDADSDSDIDPGAENWTNGYFESQHVDKLPVYNNFHSWLQQMTRLYKWRLLYAGEQNNYYFAIFAVGMNSSELAFCFRHISGGDRPLDLQVKDVNGNDLRLAQWGPNASIIQEYQVHNPETGEVLRTRDLNGYVIRMRVFPRHLRVIATEINGSKKVVFNEIISNIVDSVRGIEDLKTHKLPDTGTLDKWVAAVNQSNWQLLRKAANNYGFFAVFKLNDRTFAFCRQLKKNPGIYERESMLKLTGLNGKPLRVDFASILTLNRRYRVVKMVDGEAQVTKYSIIDGATYRTRNKLPAAFRIQYLVQGDNNQPQVCFNEKIDFGN
ncbi:MAG: hypothetical protein PHH77_09285 [Victivallaceae bacterium]|nr:hypothetical protein [Victivallaceae bacterium]